MMNSSQSTNFSDHPHWPAAETKKGNVLAVHMSLQISSRGDRMPASKEQNVDKGPRSPHGLSLKISSASENMGQTTAT